LQLPTPSLPFTKLIMKNMQVQNKEIVYKLPNLGTRRLSRYVTIFENFAHHYNEVVLIYNQINSNDKLQLLKSHHEQLYYTLLRYYNSQLSKMNRQKPLKCTIGELPELYMNNEKLSRAIHKSPTTVWRYLTKLEEAGMITKTHHGSTNDYTIRFANDFILVYDNDNAEITSDSRFLHPVSLEDRISICKPYRDTRSVNKEITDVENFDENLFFRKEIEKGVLRTSTKNPYKIPPQIDESLAQMPKDRTEKAASNFNVSTKSGVKSDGESTNRQNVAAIHKEHLLWNSRVLFIYAINNLWPGGYLWTDESGKKRFVSKPETDRTIKYIADKWFKRAKNPKEMVKWREQVFEPAILKAKSILENRKYKNWYVNPAKYFDMNYEMGFVGVVNFLYREAEIVKEHKLANKYRRCRQQAVNEYLAAPNSRNYMKLLNRLRKQGVPRKYLDEFALAAQNNAFCQ
jgi:DNA-binding Lrp family transcriptional regulator